METSKDISDADEPTGIVGDRAGLAGMYVASAFLIGQALEANNGNLDPVGLMWIGLAMIVLIAVVRGNGGWARLSHLPLRWLVGACVAVQWVELLIWGIGFRRAPGSAMSGFVIGMTIAGISVMLILLRPRFRTVGLLTLIVGHGLAGADVICKTKPVLMDAWYFQQQSTAALLHGRNPYEVRYRNVFAPATEYYAAGMVQGDYLAVSHPYPPLTLLLAAPARLLGDVRWWGLAAMELTAVLIAISFPGRSASWASAMFLLNPRALMVIYYAWTESSVMLCAACVVYCAMRRPKLLWLALGLLLAAKQYTILLLPLSPLLMPRGMNRRQVAAVIGKAIALATSITLPFLLWNPAAFVRSVVLMQVNQPFRIDALSFPALLAHFTGMELPSIVGFAVAGVCLLWARRRASQSAAGFAGAAALILLVFFAFNKQAFCNYYFLISGMCCCAAGASTIQSRSLLDESWQGNSTDDGARRLILPTQDQIPRAA